MVLGSYRELLAVTGGTFTMSFAGGAPTGTETFGTFTAASLQTDLQNLAGMGPGSVFVSQKDSTHWFITLGAKRYLTNTQNFAVSGGLASIVMDDTALKLNDPWSVEPAGGAKFEGSQYEGVHAPAGKVRIFSQATKGGGGGEPGGRPRV